MGEVERLAGLSGDPDRPIDRQGAPFVLQDVEQVAALHEIHREVQQAFVVVLVDVEHLDDVLQGIRVT